MFVTHSIALQREIDCNVSPIPVIQDNRTVQVSWKLVVLFSHGADARSAPIIRLQLQ